MTVAEYPVIIVWHFASVAAARHSLKVAQHRVAAERSHRLVVQTLGISATLNCCSILFLLGGAVTATPPVVHRHLMRCLILLLNGHGEETLAAGTNRRVNLAPNCPYSKTPMVPIQLRNAADRGRVVECGAWLVCLGDTKS